jgi:PAS domain S-box-containing protein
MKVEKIPLRYRIFFGTKLRQKIGASDIEFRRKATLLVTIYLFAIIMLPLFSTISFLRHEYFHSGINALAFCIVAFGYLYLRSRGNLTANAFMVIGILSAQFVSDFLSDPNRAMWSYTVPVISFFLLGTRRATIYSMLYFVMLLAFMFFLRPMDYPLDFKLRFIAIFFCITLFSYFFERTRQKTQEMLNKNRLMLEIQRDVNMAIGSEKEITIALDRVLQILITHLKDIDCGGMYIVEKESGALRLVAHKGLSLEFIEAVSHYTAETPNAKIVMKGDPVYTTYGDLGVPLDDVCRIENLKAITIVPVKSEGTVIAAINLSSHCSEEIPHEIRRLLESVAASIGDSISRMLAEHGLRALSSRNKAMLDAVPDIIMEVDNNKRYTWANRAGYAFFGDDAIGKEAESYFLGAQDTYERVSPIFSGSDEIVYVESWERRKDGAKRLLAWWCRSLKDDAGEICGALSSARDITDDRAMEEQLRQSQKMEAIGQLAGGIAHDFNNQLASIMGFAYLIKKKISGDEKITLYTDNILLSSQRAADLTNHLLAFARKGKYQAVKVDIHQIISEVFIMLQHTIDKKIILKQHLGAQPSTVMGDPTQLQNALLNVAINGRDAMPDGGELTFSTELVILDEQYCTKQTDELFPGPYCQICVTDSGTGMDAEIQKHLFEPFFTTKEKGKGTGMGLPAVYGIVKLHKGAINVYSEPGRGTTFKIYLPAIGVTDGRANQQNPETGSVYKSPQGLNILFVDDEKLVREMAGEMLRILGHTVTECENGKKAVEYYRNSWKSVDLVILDMIMPEMGGKETFIAMREINPAVKAILSSGYSINGEAEKILTEGVRGFIQKPFSTNALTEMISEVMRK